MATIQDGLNNLYADTAETHRPASSRDSTIRRLRDIYGHNSLSDDPFGRRDVLPTEIARAIHPEPPRTPEGFNPRRNKEK